MLEHRTYVELDMLKKLRDNNVYSQNNNKNNFSVEQHVDL